MFCEFCETSIEESFVYCPECGVELDREELIITKYFEKGYHYLKMSFIITTQFLKVSFCNFELTARLQHSFSSMCHLQWFFTRLRSCCKRAMDWKLVGFQLSISIDVPTVVTVRAGHWHIVSSSSQKTLHNATTKIRIFGLFSPKSMRFPSKDRKL